jgi:uncharacterized protein YlxP (DUF503 family)
LSFICLLELDLHLPENASLKGKRKQVQSLKAQLQRRFGAAVAETDHHDLWQRATLSVALVAMERGRLCDSADALQRFTESRFGDWVRWERRIVSSDDLEGG